MYVVSARLNAATATEKPTNVGIQSRTLRRKMLDAQTSRVVLFRYGRASVRADRNTIHEYIKVSLQNMTDHDFRRMFAYVGPSLFAD